MDIEARISRRRTVQGSFMVILEEIIRLEKTSGIIFCPLIYLDLFGRITLLLFLVLQNAFGDFVN